MLRIPDSAVYPMFPSVRHQISDSKRREDPPRRPLIALICSAVYVMSFISLVIQNGGGWGGYLSHFFLFFLFLFSISPLKYGCKECQTLEPHLASNKYSNK